LTQGSENVEEYTREFEKLVIKCDLQELEEKTIVRYFGGLDPRYANVLQAYTTFDKVCMLAYKIEQQKKSRKPHKPQTLNPLPETNLLTRGVLTRSPSPQIHPLPFHKEPKLHKRSKPLKIDPILTL